MSMRTIGAFFTGLALATSACAGSRDERPLADTAGVYAAVVRQLVTKDHTFGGEPSPFEQVFVVAGVVEDPAGPRMAPYLAIDRPFDAKVKSEIARELADLPPLEFVADPLTVVAIEEECPRVENDGVLIVLGPIAHDGGGSVTVANQLFFSCSGSQWDTYVLEPANGGWRVTGTTGPSGIA